MKKLFIRHIDDILLVVGASMVSAGMFLISIPGGLIISGLSCIGIGALEAKRRWNIRRCY